MRCACTSAAYGTATQPQQQQPLLQTSELCSRKQQTGYHPLRGCKPLKMKLLMVMVLAMHRLPQQRHRCSLLPQSHTVSCPASASALKVAVGQHVASLDWLSAICPCVTLQVRSRLAPASDWVGPSVVFRLGNKYTGGSLRIPTAHAASFRVPDQGRLVFVLPRGAEMPCSVNRGILQLSTGWPAISAALRLRTGSTVQLQQQRHGSRRFRIAKLSTATAVAAAAAPAVPAATASGTAADRPAEHQQAPQPGVAPAAAMAASAQSVEAAAAADGDGAAILRVKLPESYAGRYCSFSVAMRRQLEALLPGSGSVRPLMLVLPNGKQLPVAYRLVDGRIQRGWRAVHQALRPRPGAALYFWQAAPGSFCVSKKRIAAAAATNSSAQPCPAPCDALQQPLDPSSERPHDQVLLAYHRTPSLQVHLKFACCTWLCT